MSWGRPGGARGVPEGPRAFLEPSGGVLGHLGGTLEACWERPGRFGGFRGRLGASGGVLGAFWAALFAGLHFFFMLGLSACVFPSRLCLLFRMVLGRMVFRLVQRLR